MRQIIYVGLVLIILIGFLGGCKTSDDVSNNNGNGNNGQGSSENTIVEVGDNSFQPSSITVTAGTTVTFLMTGSNRHTVTSGTRVNPTGLFDSGDMSKGDEFQYTFSTAGTYTYFCKYHAGMDGTVNVQ